ncbi:glucose-6-phosphate isomerase [Bythopirellula goksoeyrii]|uniref:Glucose-6-phosphate isomerase n=1 Tax=Bythopirellula goksoeyrii TaxID=1400387 RepID=A0A5B9QRH1_9BACT|nr:glucose-6-phosphate isomerase [Bythopirellula goksoeyrii]QEG36583.1 Glucose-6-phosphate isomerase [Bythopirellula goksoeyrii]
MPDITISYDPRGTYLPEHGLASDELAKLTPQLTAARNDVLADAELWADGVTPPSNKVPLDAGFHYLPERLLAEYQTGGTESEVGRIIATANRFSAVVDRVVVLGIGGSYMGARALLESCCHPYFNELPRAIRDNRPRISFEGNNVDNDALQGLFDLLPSTMSKSDVDDRWGIVVISKSGGTLETASGFRILLRRLQKALGPNQEQLADLVVPVTGTSGKLFDLATALGCRELFPVPDGVGGRFSVLSAVGLLPAAIMGLDVVQLLEGAAAMNEHFRTAPVGKNVVLDYTGICHLMEKQLGCDVRLLSTWGKQLEAFGLWYDQLLAESLGKRERGALPLTIVNTRDLHSRGQQHQEGKRDKLITNIIVDQCKTAPVSIGTSKFNQDGLDELAEKTIPDVLAAATQGTNQAYREDNRPTADLHVPAINEFVMGQLFQMFMLATVVEGRLVGTNPYGQPGVEAYKKNMNAILRGN